LSNVLWQLNGGSFEMATNLSSWSAGVVLQPGANLFAVKSVDSDGMVSALVSRKFIYNPLLPRAGLYNGLFSEANGVNPAHSGLFSLTISSRDACSGSLYLGGKKHVFSGVLPMSGTNNFSVSGSPSLTLALILDIADSTGEISGQVNGDGWTAPLWGTRAQYSAPKTTNYTVAFLGDGDGLELPGGDGFARIVINGDGSAVMSGRVSDDTALAPIGASLSKDGVWPVYSSLYGGTGSLFGWMTNQAGILQGSVIWTKSVAFGPYYNSGFTNTLTAEGFEYPAFASGSRAFTNATVIFDGAGLAAPITNSVSLSSKNQIEVGAGQTNGLVLSFNPANGQFVGTFTNALSEHKIAIKGIFLRETNEGAGYFVVTNKATGSFLLLPSTPKSAVRIFFFSRLWPLGPGSALEHSFWQPCFPILRWINCAFSCANGLRFWFP
jgi:hypothetical protein